MRSIAGALIVAMCGTASAQGLDAERFTPAVGAEGGFVNEHPAVPFHLGWGLGLFFNFADDQVVERNDAGDTLSKPVDKALSADLLGSIGLGGWFELGLGLPLHLIYDGDPYGGLAAGAGVGDLRVVPKFALWRTGTLDQHILLGLALPITIPTGDDEEFRGAGGFTLGGAVLFAAHLGSLGLGLDVGFRWRDNHPPQPWGDSITIGPWLSYNLTPELALRAEVFAEKHVNTEVDGADFPIEVLAGLEYRMANGLALYGGASFGLTDGIGDPDFRIIGGLRYRKNHPENQGFRDSDGDGVLDKDDEAPYEPEDEDGYRDDDGEPEPDNDGDGVLDGDDECPELKGEKDRDGCPAKTYVTIENGEMVIIGKIQFETGSARIHKRSGPLLDQIAQAMNAHTEVKRIRIEGNTDNVGPPPLNQKLSEERASSVKEALEQRGVDGDRLRTKGNGETKPIAPNKSAGGRQKNRRVEFFIEEGK